MKTRQNRCTQSRKQSRRRGGSQSRKRNQSRRRGGSFYPYNTKPMIFTNVSNQQGGDSRNTVLPSFITNMGRDAAYQVGQVYNSFAGNYSSVNPHPSHQNLSL